MPCEDCERIVLELGADLKAKLTAVCEVFEQRERVILDDLTKRLNEIDAKQQALLANVERAVQTLFTRLEAVTGIREEPPPVCH